MLQWMGGSRRKVATSRKSTYKRQKQYFEQRKRQQQHTAGCEIYADENNSGNQHCENNRSLDVLSLVNVSTVIHKPKSSHLDARDESEDDDDDFTSNHQNSNSPSALVTNKNILVDQCQEEENSPSYYPENEDSKKVPACLPVYDENWDRHGHTLDHLKLSTSHQISVIDLLGDGGASNNVEENSGRAQEAHVAFSVEGLGKVELETPVHSPEIPGRSFLNGLSSPRKARLEIFPSKHLDFDFDDFLSMEDIYSSPKNSNIEQSFRTRDTMKIVGNPNQKSLSVRKSPLSNWNDNALKGVLDDEELLYGISDRDMWNGPSFLEESTGYRREYESFNKNWMDQRDFSRNDYFNIKEQWRQDFNCERWNVHNKRSTRTRANKTPNFDMAEKLPYEKHQIPDELHDFNLSDTSWYSTIGMDNNVKDAVNRFLDDTRESLSLLSEESSSSTAVRGNTTKPS